MHVFAWDPYYPCGGYNDFIGEVSNMDDAYAMLRSSTSERYQIVQGSRVVSDGYIKDIPEKYEPEQEIETWHCNGCDGDHPHIIIFRGETLPETIQTKCTVCKRETYR